MCIMHGDVGYCFQHTSVLHSNIPTYLSRSINSSDMYSILV
jgi:hypothetical protein